MLSSRRLLSSLLVLPVAQFCIEGASYSLANPHTMRDEAYMLVGEIQPPGHDGDNAPDISCQAKGVAEQGRIHGGNQLSGTVTPSYYHRVTLSRVISGKAVSEEKKGIQGSIEALKTHLKISSGRRLATLLSVSPMSVHRWEMGIDPDERGLIQLAKVSPENLRWTFLEKAGLSRSDILQFLPENALISASRPPPKIEVISPSGARGEGLRLKKKTDYIALPLLRDSAAAGEPRMIDDRQVEDMIIVRSALCPNPQETVCVKVSGDSMSPVLLDGYVVAIDTSITDRKALYKQMVAATDPSGGCTIKWLRKSGKDELLVPQHTAPHYDPIVITNSAEWRIIGKILWWIGFPRPTS